jgi:hypothetical protein
MGDIYVDVQAILILRRSLEGIVQLYGPVMELPAHISKCRGIFKLVPLARIGRFERYGRFESQVSNWRLGVRNTKESFHVGVHEETAVGALTGVGDGAVRASIINLGRSMSNTLQVRRGVYGSGC